VERDTPAAQRGLSVGDVILEVDNAPIASADDFNKAIEGVRSKGLETALIKVARNGDSTFIGLPITE